MRRIFKVRRLLLGTQIVTRSFKVQRHVQERFPISILLRSVLYSFSERHVHNRELDMHHLRDALLSPSPEGPPELNHLDNVAHDVLMVR